MPDYNFERLSDKDFERLANALGTEYIARGLMIYGSGTDGGRESAFEGRMRYPTVENPWDGYLVVQCKQKETRGKSPKEEGQWAIGKLDEEMIKYKTAKRKRRIPDYLLFITNAQLSAQLETGGKDKFVERLKYWAQELGIKGADVWDRDKLTNLLDGSQKIAQRFGMLHDGDLIHYAARAILAHREGIDTTLSLFLQEELRADQFVNLAQAGHTNDDRTPLARVFVDLRAAKQGASESRFYVVDTVQKETDHPVHPTLVEQEVRAKDEHQRRLEDELDLLSELAESEQGEEEDVSVDEESDEDDLEDTGDETDEEEPPTLSYEEIKEMEEAAAEFNISMWHDPSRFVVVGGPGQGKSTLAQQLAQRHRAALLKANATRPLEIETARILKGIEDAAVESGTGLPKHPRWPFRVVLEQFADKLATGEVTSVLEYIAFMVRKRTKREFTHRDAEELLTTSAWFVAFDGLDEVPAVSNRAEVLAAVKRFLLEAHDKDADVLVVATTRPQGYGGEFGTEQFNHLLLQAFSKEEALTYAKKFVEAKYATEPDRRERIMQRLETAAQEEAIVRLMQTPLQVTIMAALVDLVGNPPRERYLLFNRYYEIIYQREQERGLKLSDVLARFRSRIEILHDRIGLLLQIEAESAGKSEARIDRVRLEKLIHDYLTAEEFEGEMLEQTKAQFMDVALHRLVFIVPLEDERYGFEVRSLQEFAAARALMRGDYSVVKNRLRRIATMPYWRNTLLFAVGRAFVDQNEPLCDMITQLCRELNDDTEEPALSRTLAGSRLAADILEDGIVEYQFRYRRLFFETALRLLQLPHYDSVVRVAKLYTPSDEQRYKEAVQATVGGSSAPIGALLMLGTLDQKGEKPDWAQQMLKQYWPLQQLEYEQFLLEKLYRRLLWDEWLEEIVVRIARNSPVLWVVQHLSEKNPIKWIRDARAIRYNRRSDPVVLASPERAFCYYLNHPKINQDVLERIKEANPIHPSWAPYLVTPSFFLEPSPETLASTMEAVAEHHTYAAYSDMPWQLTALLNQSESAEELLQHAQRARRGELGTLQDWQAAEARWQTNGFTVADLCAFSDEEWPYTAKVGQVGMPPAGTYGPAGNDEPEHEATLMLVEAFNNVPSVRYRANLAGVILFFNGVTYSTNTPALILPFSTVSAIASAARWNVVVSYVIPLLDIHADWVEAVKELDIIGGHLSAIDDNNREAKLPIIKYQMRVAALKLLPLLGGRTVREGILRFLAALVVTGVEVDMPEINRAALSSVGRVALAAIDLFSNKPSIEADILAQEILDYWSYKNPVSGNFEMQRVVSVLVKRQTISTYAVEVLNIIYADQRANSRAKNSIIEVLLSQIQYRTSELNNPLYRKELAMNWLFETAE